MAQITTDDLRQMEDKEGLILQGCGGPVQEWIDGINDMLTEEGILLNGSKFTNVSSFQLDGLTNLLFPLDDVDVNLGRLAMWRLQTHGQLGGTWLSDYVPNRLGGFLKTQAPEKPDCCLIGEDGNIFNLMGIASRALRTSGLPEQAEEMQKRIMDGECKDYYAALNVIGEYVNITGPEEPAEEMGGMTLE